MRIRSTKPEFWRSERIAAISWDARLVLKGLESYVDDNGVGKDDIALIVADVFPRDMLANPRETVARVSEAISELHRAGFIHRYTASDTHLLFVSWWESVQRIDKPGKGRLPRPDGTMEYRDSEIRESVASARESVAPGTGEQGNRGTEEISLSGASDARDDPATPPPPDYPAKPIPDDWAPNDRHAVKARSKNLDLTHEAETFRDWAHAGDRRYVDWDARFSQWVANARTPEPAARGTPTTNGRVYASPADERVAQAQALKSGNQSLKSQRFLGLPP